MTNTTRHSGNSQCRTPGMFIHPADDGSKNLPFTYKKNSSFRACLVVMSVLILMAPQQLMAQNPCPEEHMEALKPAIQEAEWAVEWWMPRHKDKLKEPGRESAKLLLIGDSITHGWEMDGKETWDKYFGRYGTYNIGYSGDRTENVLWRLKNGEVDGISPELAIVLIGTNNTGHREDPPECTARGIELILQELKERLPETRVLLLAIFPRGATPDDPHRQINSGINERIAGLADDNRVTFLDINDQFLNDAGEVRKDAMPDLLHPNEPGYVIWAKEMKPVVKRLLE